MLGCPLSPRAYRLLARVSRLPGLVTERLVEHLGGLQRLLATSLGDLQSVDVVGDARARSAHRRTVQARRVVDSRTVRVMRSVAAQPGPLSQDSESGAGRQGQTGTG
jgi:hypothetical protein